MRLTWLAAAAIVFAAEQANAAELVTTADLYYGLNGQSLAGAYAFPQALGTLTSVQLTFDVRSEYYFKGSSFDDSTVGNPVPAILSISVNTPTKIRLNGEVFPVEVVVQEPTSIIFSGSQQLAFIALGKGTFVPASVSPYVALPGSSNFLELSAFADSQFTFSTTGFGTAYYDAVGNRVRVTARYTYNPVAAAAVPEPASWALIVAGLGVMGGYLRKRRSFSIVPRVPGHWTA